MKLLVLGLFCLACFCLRAADATDPIPTEIKLTGGGVLRGAKVERFEKNRVIIRHRAGVDGIPYTNIQQPVRSALEAARDAALAIPPAAPAAETPKTKIFQGEVSVATRGGISVKLGRLRVYAFPLTALGNFESAAVPVELPKPLSVTVTDPEGRFTLTVPGDEKVFIFAQGSRSIALTGESFEWRISEFQITNPANVLLENRNLASRSTRVHIAGED